MTEGISRKPARDGLRQRGKTWSWNAFIGGKQVEKGGYRTKAEAKAARAEAIAAASKNTFVKANQMTFAQFAEDWWKAAAPGLKVNTRSNYRSILDHRLLPHLGRIRLQALTVNDVLCCYAALRENGRADGKGGLTETGVEHAHVLLRRMLASAVKRDLVARNVADLLDERPRRDDHEAAFWTAEQLELFLTTTQDPRQWHQDRRQWPIWVITAMTGMRRGEIAGLKWTDVDLEAGRVTIRRARVSVDYEVHEALPKSRKGRGATKIRTIDISPRTVDAFRRWASQQAEECQAAGEGWTETGFVFTREDGLPLHPASISQAFERARDRVMDQLGLPRIPFHGLRHSAASTLLEQGVHLKVVAERLGHSSTQITSQIYSHVAPRLHSEAALLAETAVFRPREEHGTSSDTA